MNEDLLYQKILIDLKKLGLSNAIKDVNIFFKGYSKTYYGRYFPDSKRIFIYQFSENLQLYDYSSIFKNVLHELVHHIQYSNPKFIRKKGVMHDPQFWHIYNSLIDKASKLKILEFDLCKQSIGG